MPYYFFFLSRVFIALHIPFVAVQLEDMRSDFFSEEVLNSYIHNLKMTVKAEDRLKRSQYIVDWLDWLKSKDFISKEDYERSLRSVKKEMNFKDNKNRDMARTAPEIFNKYFVAGVILLAFTLLYLYRGSIMPSKYTSSKDKLLNSRTLPYKGKLLDERGLPITNKTDIIFRIYASPNTGKAIYTGSCKGQNAIEPDYNGNFTVILGADCGMSNIPESIFQTNKEIYLGVQLGSGTELSPRQKISTSGYSNDAAKLQGLPLGSERGSIPFINDRGQVLFKQNNPVLKSTTGTFTLESPDITIKTTGEESGSILFQPSSKGNTIVGNGKFAVGTFTPVTLFTAEGMEPFSSVGSIRNMATDDNKSLAALSLYIGSPIVSTDSTFVKFYAEATQESEGKEAGSIRLNNGGVAYETSGADFAEYFATEEAITAPGYILSLSSAGIHKGHPSEKIVGITSDRAGFVGNKKYTNKNNSLVALVGQVKVFIVNVSGEINIGDPISVSAVPGYGQKGRADEEIAGYALEDSEGKFNDNCPKRTSEIFGTTIKCGKILILLK